MTIFGERLKDLRKEEKITQVKLGKILNTTNSSVCDWECGRSEPDLETLVKISDYFNVTVDYLLGRYDSAL